MNSPVIGKENLIDNKYRITYNQNDEIYNPIGEIYELEKFRESDIKNFALKSKNFHDDEYYIGRKFKSMISSIKSNNSIKKDLQFKINEDKNLRKSKHYDNKLKYEVTKSKSEITLKKDFLVMKGKHYNKNHDDYFKSIAEKKYNHSFDDYKLKITNNNLKRVNTIEYFNNPSTFKFYFKNSIIIDNDQSRYLKYEHNFIHSSSNNLHLNDSYTLRNKIIERDQIRINYFNNRLRINHSFDEIYNSNNQYIFKRCGTYNKKINNFKEDYSNPKESMNTIQTAENVNNNKKRVNFNKNVVVVLVSNWKKETKKMTYNGEEICCECLNNCMIF